MTENTAENQSLNRTVIIIEIVNDITPLIDRLTSSLKLISKSVMDWFYVLISYSVNAIDSHDNETNQ